MPFFRILENWGEYIGTLLLFLLVEEYPKIFFTYYCFGNLVKSKENFIECWIFVWFSEKNLGKISRGFFAHLMETYPLEQQQQLRTSSEFEALQGELGLPNWIRAISTLHLAAGSFRQDNFLSTKSMSFVGPSRAALIKSSKAKSDGDSFSWTVRHWCNIWNNTEQWLCFTCIWDFIINPVFVVCLCLCIFDNHIVY